MNHHRRTHLLIIVVLVLLGLVYALRVGPPVTYPAFGFDSSLYLVTAKALSEGQGFRLINDPDSPVSPLVPIGYPAMLAVALRFVSLDPIGITVLRGITVLTCLIFLFFSYRLLWQYVSPTAAAVTVFLIGFQSQIVLWVGEIMSECPFAMWTSAAVFFAARSLSKDGKIERRWWSNIALAGLFAGLAVLTRTLGFTIIAGIVIAFALNHRWRKLVVFAGASSLILGPWLIWSALFIQGGGSVNNYMQWASSRYSWWRPIANLWSLIAEAVPAIYFAPAGTPLGRQLLNQWGLHLSWTLPILGSFFAAIFLVGLIALLKRHDVVAWCAVLYLAVLIFYPWEPSRYLVPVYPLLAIPLITGAKLLWRQGERFRVPARVQSAALVAVLAICAIGLLITNLFGISNVYMYGHFGGPRSARIWNDLSAGFNWIKQNVPENGVVVSPYPYGTYLFTDRLTIPEPETTPKLESVVSKVNRDSAVFMFAKETYLENQEVSITPLKGFATKHPERVRLRWETPDHKMMICEVINSGGGLSKEEISGR